MRRLGEVPRRRDQIIEQAGDTVREAVLPCAAGGDALSERPPHMRQSSRLESTSNSAQRVAPMQWLHQSSKTRRCRCLAPHRAQSANSVSAAQPPFSPPLCSDRWMTARLQLAVACGLRGKWCTLYSPRSPRPLVPAHRERPQCPSRVKGDALSCYSPHTPLRARCSSTASLLCAARPPHPPTFRAFL